MVDIVILFSVVAWLATLAYVTPATAAVCLAAFGVWIAVLARIQQADKHHRKLMEALAARTSL